MLEKNVKQSRALITTCASSLNLVGGEAKNVQADPGKVGMQGRASSLNLGVPLQFSSSLVLVTVALKKYLLPSETLLVPIVFWR
jgi:hypothetical protein